MARASRLLRHRHGPVRVVLTPENAPDLGAGYILVCPSTDPSWTPLFAKAAGLVLERGGALSHGAIVARELGLPAVVLDSATRLFVDGEIINIDANHGRVDRACVPGDTSFRHISADTDSVKLDRALLPPPVGPRETSANQLALLAAILWCVFLAGFYLLPEAWVKDPSFRLIDFMLWPLVRGVGRVCTVALVGGAFSLFLLVAQRRLTDNARLFEAKRRSAALRRLAAKLPFESQRRAAMTAAAQARHGACAAGGHGAPGLGTWPDDAGVPVVSGTHRSGRLEPRSGPRSQHRRGSRRRH